MKATRRFLSPVVASLLVTASGAASASPTTLVDRSALGAVANGTVSAGEYSSAGSTGINAGFGNVIGSGTTYGVEADVLGGLTFGLSGSAAQSCSVNDVVVIYLDTRAGGFAATTGFTDAADKHRAAISGMSIAGPARADITFAPGFQADYAIAWDRGFAGVWELQNGGAHTFVDSLTLTPETTFDASCDHEMTGLSLSEIGLAPGASFRYVATLLNPTDGAGAFRSNELHGVAPSTLPGGNPGSTTVTLASGDFNTFESVLVTLNEVDVDQSGTDQLEYIELYDGGAGNVDLDGLALVLFNGTTDASYRTVDLDGASTNAGGYIVIGDDGVAGASILLGSSDQIQNGADAVALFFAEAATLPNGTAVTTTLLVDAMVYDTADADDPELLVLTPGQPQVDEDANGAAVTESMQRCFGAPLTTTGYLLSAPTPGAANVCVFCGNGMLDAGEQCDTAGETMSCDGDCTDVVCGDGELNEAANEACDDGNTMPGDGCDATCSIEGGSGGGGMGGAGGAGGMGEGGMGGASTSTSSTSASTSSTGSTTSSSTSATTGSTAATTGSTSSSSAITSGGTGVGGAGVGGGGAEDGDGADGCDCAAGASQGNGGGAAATLMLLLALVRRRRSSARRRSM